VDGLQQVGDADVGEVTRELGSPEIEIEPLPTDDAQTMSWTSAGSGLDGSENESVRHHRPVCGWV
jgi:hypothetical protein